MKADDRRRLLDDLHSLQYSLELDEVRETAWAANVVREAATLLQAEARPAEGDTGESLLNPVSQVYFRAGLIACREYMARFVEAESPSIAQSIRANWWPSLGPDFGPPRKIAFGELTDGDYGTPAFRCKTAEEVSPTLEALPVALGFLESAQEPQR